MSEFWWHFLLVLTAIVGAWAVFMVIRALVIVVADLFPKLDIDDAGFVAMVIFIVLAFALGAAALMTYGNQPIGGMG